MYGKSRDENGQPLPIAMATIEQLSALLSRQETLRIQLDEVKTKIQQTETEIAQGTITAERDGIINEVTTFVRGDMLSSGTVIAIIISFNESKYIINIGKRKQMLVGLVTVQQRRRYPCDLRVVFDYTDAVCNELIIYSPDTLGYTETP